MECRWEMPLSNKQAGSLQMGPRWRHYLSRGMEPGEMCWEGWGPEVVSQVLRGE